MFAEILAGIVTTGARDSLRAASCDGGTSEKGQRWIKKEPGAAYDRSNPPQISIAACLAARFAANAAHVPFDLEC
jgi:hypothetical protein